MSFSIGRAVACLTLTIIGLSTPPHHDVMGSEVGELMAVDFAADAADDRERAIELAREGRYDEALAILRRLHDEDPSDVGLRGDLAAVLAWSGRDEEAVELGAGLPFGVLDPVIAESIARALRNTGDPFGAAHLYLGVVARDENRIEAHLGAALSLLEAGDHARALEYLPILRTRFGADWRARLAAGHLVAAMSDWVMAAAEYRLAFILAGEAEDQREALLFETLALREAGAHLLAVDRMTHDPDALPGEFLADLFAGRSARHVGWAPVVPDDPHPEHRFDGARRALTEVDSMMLRVDELPAEVGEEAALRLLFDRLVALREGYRMEEVRRGARELEEDERILPPHAERAAADAALSLGLGREAADRYRATLEAWPGDPSASMGLFWALVDQRRFRQADAWIADFLGEQPDQLWGEGLREPVTNRDLLPATLARLTGRAFAADLATAENALVDLHHRAPLNLEVRQELASVHLWRGHPRRAMELWERTVALDPAQVRPRVGIVSAALAIDERGKARVMADTLAFLAPENEHARRAIRAVRVDGLWELTARYGTARSTGGEFGTRDESLTTRLQSPPIGDRTRLFIASERTRATYPDGRGIHDRVGVGIQFRSEPIRFSVEANADRIEMAEPGATVSLLVRRGDHLNLYATTDTRTTRVPLQAARLGIRGWSATTGIDARAHEGRSWHAEAGYLDMTDGNRRPHLLVALEQQVARAPDHRFALRGEGYGATNSRDGAPYFNPAHLLSATATLLWDWTLHRHHERSWAQRVALTGGIVAQANEAIGPVAWFTVEHRWAVSDQFALLVGIHGGLPVYDGVRERRTSVHAGLTWRLP